MQFDVMYAGVRVDGCRYVWRKNGGRRGNRTYPGVRRDWKMYNGRAWRGGVCTCTPSHRKKKERGGLVKRNVLPSLRGPRGVHFGRNSIAMRIGFWMDIGRIADLQPVGGGEGSSRRFLLKEDSRVQ